MLPIGYLVIRAADAGLARILDVLARQRTLELIGRSLLLVVLVTSLSVVIGVGLAFIATRSDVPGRRVIAAVAALPLAIPSYVAAFAWISAIPEIAGLTGAVLVLTLCCYPYVYLPVLAALRPRLRDRARESVELLVGAGIGVFIYYYPTVPLRLAELTLPDARGPAEAGGKPLSQEDP